MTPDPKDLAREAGRTAAERKAERLAKGKSAYDLPERWDPKWTLPVPAVNEQDLDLDETARQAAQEHWEELVSDRRDEETIERE